MTGWLAQAAGQVPRLHPADRRILLDCRTGRIALAIYRAGLVLLLLDSDWRLDPAEIPTAT